MFAEAYTWSIRRWLATLAAGAWILLGLYLVFLHRDAPVDVAPVAEAAERSKSFDGFRAEMIANFESKALTMQMNGRGAFNAQTGRSELSLRTLGAPNGDFTFSWVSDGRYVYVSMPEPTAGSFRGKAWVKLDLADFACRGSADPEDQVDQLRSVETTETIVGIEQVRGVETIHYRATLDLVRQQQLLREQGQHDTARSLGLLVDKGHPAQLEADVWVDEDRLIRREEITIPFAIFGGKNPHLKMQMDFFAYGTLPQIDLPPRNSVYDATGNGKKTRLSPVATNI